MCVNVCVLGLFIFLVHINDIKDVLGNILQFFIHIQLK